MDLRLDRKVALVTGSSKGIGEAVAKTLAREGARVVVHGQNAEDSLAVARAIVDEGGRAHAVVGDLTKDDEVERLVRDAQAAAGRIDILVNNAGGSGETEDWTTTRPQTWAAGYDRNVLAALRTTASLLPAMRTAGWGRIINVSSLAALMPPPGRPDYAAAKAAMVAMTASLAKAVAADGVTANTVSPGTIHSARLEQAFRKAVEGRGMPFGAAWADVEREMLPTFAQVPMGRVGTLDEIADAIAFLASPRAGYITGVNLRIDGGMFPGL
ncbi:SDR family NAD(P)-dependent oxidoreductase [Aurantimonas sp. MSK8Z-1]|uniref:SDR family NAD(P)-dependent oxidoreductase n=1 Tax=Mangrovibrevibacter kandeliae TaxID=2968473 RepID=UPI0021177A1F|nr:SDR family NAD(P)-dependent oxidoreductase [Aurantimonas sp. MSK8Z-1]MCW4114010.1 SDR family NAD(P)-dependent oxidoreductase [Aurantimonas sp. MSK8Z-1]